MRGFRKQIVKKRRKLLNKLKSNFNVISEKHMKLKRLSKNKLNNKQLRQQLTKPVRKRRLERQSSTKLSSLLERLKRLSLKLRSKNRLVLALQSKNQSVQLQLLQSDSRSRRLHPRALRARDLVESASNYRAGRATPVGDYLSSSYLTNEAKWVAYCCTGRAHGSVAIEQRF
ncbi:hypothetical protein PABG_11480 [Paracoccidioides brasiliensis Pb03]|nr:hypothetical protein PABG_11480 [Paracoccidioides brasiliensis Pb03]